MDTPQPDLADVTLADLPPRLREAAARAGWTALMPVQARALPPLLAGQEVMIQARTGSGKTGAYLLPMLERLNPSQPACQALILTPTRELARQVWHEAELLCAPAGLRSVAVYGGVGYGAQTAALRAGAHIVVGTPGRVLDHLLRRNFTLDALTMLILDEADHMLSMGFYPDMRRVQSYLPNRPVQTGLFSATFPEEVLRTAHAFLAQPRLISLSQDHVHVVEVEHAYYRVPGVDKDRALVRFIELENPTSAIIFCNTKARVHYVTVVLQRYGYDAAELSADLPQADREQVLARLRHGQLRFLVATDVAARGLDIPALSHVIQYEPPEDLEAYIHRAGRTGRAGASGTALTLTYPLELPMLERIAKRYGINLVERPLPTEAEVEAVVAERLTALLEARLRDRDSLQTDRARRFLPLARALADEDELPLIAMLLDDEYQKLLHAPPPAFEASARPVTAPADSGRRGGGRRSGRRR